MKNDEPLHKPRLSVFAAAAMPRDLEIISAAEALGWTIGFGGYDVIVGGAIGLMGVVARAAQSHGSHVTIVNLVQYQHEEQLPGATTVFVENEAARFAVMAMDSKPERLFVLPGGPGTLVEGMSAIFKAVYESGPPVVLVKVKDYLDGITHYFNRAVQAGMIKSERAHVLQEWKYGDGIYPGVPLKTQPPKIM
jgi:hypothetical protein